MSINRKRLYLIVFTACMAGYFWLYFSISNNLIENNTVEVCMVKHITDIPCPSCGSTRAVISLTEGNFIEAIAINPFSYILAIIMLVSPVWIVFDLLKRRSSFYRFYRKSEMYLRNPKVAVLLIGLVVMNWVWNITKGL